MKKRRVKPQGLLLADAHKHRRTRLLKPAKPAGPLRMRIGDGANDPGDARLDQKLCASRLA
jgi:hypothetical protein